MIIAERHFGGRADHPVGQLAVSLAGSDLEPAGQRGSRERQRHQIANREVGRPADHPAFGTSPGGGPPGTPRGPGRLQVPPSLLARRWRSSVVSPGSTAARPAGLSRLGYGYPAVSDWFLVAG